MKKLILSVCLVGASYLTANAQDPHFSQFYQSPLTLNPALTGMFNAKARIGLNYRNQWATVSAPYQTFAVSGEMGLAKEALNGDFVGVGANLMTDIAGDGNYRSTSLTASAAYHKSIGPDENQFLTAGVQLGAVQRDLNFSKLFFDSQYDGSSLNPNLPSGENFQRQNFWFLDVSAGLGYTLKPTDGVSFYAGAALFHINQPNQSFLGQTELLYRKIVLNAGGEFRLGDQVSLMPQAVFMSQGPARETNLGALLKFRLGGNDWYNASSNAFYAGATYRLGDAAIFHLRMDYGAFVFGLSYDTNVSSLIRASRSVGGPELSIMYKIGKDDSGSGMKCPSF